jgi:predicted aspartyl protease
LPPLLAAARAAAGGDAWDRVQVIESQWSIALAGLTGTLASIEDVAQGRSRHGFHLGPIETTDGFDGNVPWARAAGGEVLKRDAPEAIAMARTQAWMTRRGYLRPGGAHYRELEARDDGGRRLRGLEATPEGGAPVELWFDDANQLARTSQRLGPLTVVTDYSDWREVDGVRLAFHVVVDRGDPRNRATLALTSVHQRPAMPASVFAAAEPDAGRLQFTEGHTSELRVDLINNHLFVDAKVDGQPVRMVLDTGGVNALTPAAVARLGLKSEGEAAAYGGGDQQVAMGAAHGKTLELGGVVLERPVFTTMDLGAVADSDGEDVDGLIGFELFSRVAVRIDYAGRRVTLTAPSAFKPPAGAIAVPIEMSQHIPIVRGTVDGIAARLWVDTGWRAALTATDRFTRDHDLMARYHARFETTTGWGIGGPLRTWPVRIHEIAIGGVSVRDVVGGLFAGDKSVLADPEASGFIGTGVLGQFVVTFDYAGRTMYLEPGAPVRERETFDRSGLYLIRAGGALRVAAVAPTGPAEHAGLRVDDRITAIDGARIETRRLWQWRAYLREHAPGTKVALRIERAGTAQRDVTIQLAELVP